MSATHTVHHRQAPTLLAFGFRPFFLLTGGYAALVILGWMGFLFANWPLPLGWSPIKWHSHEMLYGVVPAAIAGFVLTAMTNWTGAKPLAGRPLLAVVTLWIAGRILMWTASWVPSGLVAAVDLAFLPILGIYLARVLLQHGNKRNLVLVGVLAVLALGNGLMHWGFITGSTVLLTTGEQLGFNLILLLMIIIAGRIVPAFTAGWLNRTGGNPAWVTRSATTDKIAVASAALLIPLDAFQAPQLALGVVAVTAGLANGLRLIQWAGWRTLNEPLLWVLHVAYLCIVASLLLRGLDAFTDVISRSLWQHTLGVGGMGILILGVMTRVAMGHTGRALRLAPYGLVIYVAIIAATLLRLAAALQWLDYRLGVTLAAVAWILAFSLFVVLYWPILSRPRVDNKPG